MTVRTDVQYIRQSQQVAGAVTGRSTATLIPPFSFVGGNLTIATSGRYYIPQPCRITEVILSGENGNVTNGMSSIVVAVNDSVEVGLSLPWNQTKATVSQLINMISDDYLTVASLSTAGHTGVVVQFIASLVG